MTTFINEVQITEADCRQGWYDIDTAKGKHLQVVFDFGRVFVKQINSTVRAYGNFTMGREFATLADAVEAYKNKDIKQALRALISHLV